MNDANLGEQGYRAWVVVCDGDRQLFDRALGAAEATHCDDVVSGTRSEFEIDRSDCRAFHAGAGGCHGDRVGGGGHGDRASVRREVREFQALDQRCAVGEYIDRGRVVRRVHDAQLRQRALAGDLTGSIAGEHHQADRRLEDGTGLAVGTRHRRDHEIGAVVQRHRARIEGQQEVRVAGRAHADANLVVTGRQFCRAIGRERLLEIEGPKRRFGGEVCARRGNVNVDGATDETLHIRCGMQNPHAGRARRDRCAGLGQNERLDVLHIVEGDDGVNRFALQREIGRADDGCVTAGQDSLNLDRIGSRFQADPARGYLVIDVGERFFTVDQDIHCGRIGRRMQYLQGCGGNRRTVATRVTGGESKHACHDEKPV